MNDRFVTYRLYWTDTEIRFTVTDGGTEYALHATPFAIGGEADEFQAPFYFLLNLAVGGKAGPPVRAESFAALPALRSTSALVTDSDTASLKGGANNLELRAHHVFAPGSHEHGRCVPKRSLRRDTRASVVAAREEDLVRVQELLHEQSELKPLLPTQV